MSYQQSDQLFDNERVVYTSTYPMLVCHRPGARSRPLLVLAPGGGHLARIFYGHPNCDRRDYLMHWLSQLGYESVAISYPSDHPAIPADCSGMTVREWATCMAEVCASIVSEDKAGRRIILVGWSMAGRLAHVFKQRLASYGIASDYFISLAATAPLLNLAPNGSSERTPHGLWDSASRSHQWLQQIQNQSPAGQTITRAQYQAYYLCNNPMALRADSGTADADVESILKELGTFDYAQYPICGGVIPSGNHDPRHALTDRATWSFLNTQMIYSDLRERSPRKFEDLDPSEWEEFQRRTNDLSRKLFRRIDGNHFFFVGRPGARRTAKLIQEVIEEMVSFTTYRSRTFGVA